MNLLALIPPAVWTAVATLIAAARAAAAKAAAVREVQDLIDKGDKQQAIDKALKAFNIDTSKTKSTTYDATVSGEAVTSKDGTVKVGDEAFRDAGWLGSSLGHETEVHVNQQADQGKWYTGAIGTPLQEVQAYDYEIANADRYGTTAANLQDLQNRRDGYYNQLPADYKTRADAGNYDMKPGEENN